MTKKILIIDDSPTILNIMKAMFEDEGLEVITAETGKEGLDKAISGAPQLAIIDTILPDTDGFQVCEKIRQIKTQENLKIIMMTGNVDAIDAVKARRVGADDYVVKTSDLGLLMEAAKNLL